MSALTVSAEDEKKLKGQGFLNNKGTDNFSARVITINGKVTAEQMRHVAEAAEKFGNGTVTFTTRLTMEVQGIPYENIEDFKAFLAEKGMTTGGTGKKVRPVVSCKGTTCHFGLIDTFALSEEIHHRFYEGYRSVVLPHKFKIAVGGCPNNCVKPDLNDIGIIGQCVPTVDKEKCRGCKKCAVMAACPVHANAVTDGKMEFDRERCKQCGRCVGKCYFDAVTAEKRGYKVYVGGRWGKDVAQGRALGRIFTEKEEVLAIVEKAILLFREQGKDGERFSQTVERIGFENVEAQLFGDEILSRKEQILSNN